MFPFGLVALGAAIAYNHSLEEDDNRRRMKKCTNCRHFCGFGKRCEEGWKTPRRSTCWDEDSRD